MTMAETLANGTTIPQGSDPIHGSGVLAMRNLGGSVDGQLGNRYTKAQADALLAGKSPVGHGHQISDVEGLGAALGAAGGSASWAQVTDKPSVFPPSEHTHPVSDVTGLAARLAALEYDSGWRVITPDTGVTGTIKVKRAASGAGDRTTIRLEGVLPPAGVGSAYIATLPLGFRHTGEHWFIADGRAGEVPSVIGLYNGSRAAWVMTVAGGTTRPTDPITGEYTWESPDARPPSA